MHPTSTTLRPGASERSSASGSTAGSSRRQRGGAHPGAGEKGHGSRLSASVGDTASPMRALQVHDLIGPDGVAVADVPEPDGGDDLLVVDVRAGGVSFVDLLLSRGEYQVRPEP